MEFYSISALSSAFSFSFQFPTGWNSTVYKLSGNRILGGFNSQRDGILPNLSALISMELKRVSIPNGMEFYGAVLRIGAGVRQSFNSQRDGILHYSTNINSNFFSVSIPNGMEFYFSKRF